MPKQEPWDLPEAGSFNVAPQYFEPITEAQFSREFFTWTIEKIVYRQLHRTYTGEPIRTLQDAIPSGQGYLETRLFWIHNGMGYAMAKTWETEPRILHFRMGVCKHEWRELSQAAAQSMGIQHYGMFCHVYHCSKCNRHYTTDSSD
jgi:hypothetical protein